MTRNPNIKYPRPRRDSNSGHGRTPSLRSGSNAKVLSFERAGYLTAILQGLSPSSKFKKSMFKNYIITPRYKIMKTAIECRKKLIIANFNGFIVVSPASIDIPISSGRGVAIVIPAKM